jgi:hypothetical protein
MNKTVDKMGGHVVHAECTQILGIENAKKIHLKDLGVDGRTILKRVLNK